MKVLGIDHIMWIIKNLEESIEFYTKTCGFEVEGRRSDGADLRMFPGGPTFELFLKPSEDPSPSHICIVVDDLDATVKELREKGHEIKGPRVHPSGRRLADLPDPSGSFFWQLMDSKHEQPANP